MLVSKIAECFDHDVLRMLEENDLVLMEHENMLEEGQKESLMREFDQDYKEFGAGGAIRLMAKRKSKIVGTNPMWRIFRVADYSANKISKAVFTKLTMSTAR